jgi:hypothetical protein
VDDYHTFGASNKRLQHANARSYYKWLISIIKDTRVTISHVKAHTNGRSPEQILNDLVDKAVSSSHTKRDIPYAPTPTFLMNEFTIFRKDIGWFEGNTRELITCLETNESLRK